MKRIKRLCWSEKMPEGSVVRLLLLREIVKGVKKEGMMIEWKGEGREDREDRPVKMEEGREERLL